MTETANVGPQSGPIASGGDKVTEEIFDGNDAYQGVVTSDGCWIIKRWLRDDKSRETVEVVAVDDLPDVPVTVFQAIALLGGEGVESWTN